ncbi:MAG TPA: GNAT family N-acetyltransferase [Cytophagales bacterium]|nr:GNAT family N-acetyltransferase [Cytophagales bacterium]
MNIRVIHSDLSSAKEGTDLITLLSHYAEDIMGGGESLSEYVKGHLIQELKKRNDALVILAYIDEEAAGLAICFEGFSTFYAKPLINIHDLVVKEQYRGLGLAKALLHKIESIAKDRNCCKLTLEVLQGNQRAQNVYQAFGFRNYQLDEGMGNALFLHKAL